MKDASCCSSCVPVHAPVLAVCRQHSYCKHAADTACAKLQQQSSCGHPPFRKCSIGSLMCTSSMNVKHHMVCPPPSCVHVRCRRILANHRMLLRILVCVPPHRDNTLAPFFNLHSARLSGCPRAHPCILTLQAGAAAGYHHREPQAHNFHKYCWFKITA
eukprot:1161053-Pelagomonas_calceolata.AAC.19